MMRNVIIFTVLAALCQVTFGQDKSLKENYLYAHDTIIYANDDSTLFYQVENLGDKINSKHVESGPRISHDGKTLYFFRIDHPQNVAHTRDIWMSQLADDDSTWSEAKHMGEPLNNHGNNSVHSISTDGKKLLLHNIYMKNGTVLNGLSISEKQNDGTWTFPEPLHVKKFKNDEVCSFFMNDQWDVLILCIHGKDSKGHQDLYVSFKYEKHDKEYWTQPKNMGKVVNSAGSEATAFLAADGKTLYFSSNGRENTVGGFDIYKTTRLDSSWTKWSEPENLGKPFNTEDDEFYFSLPAKSDYAYLSHHFKGSDSLEHSDIVRIKLREHDKANPVVLLNLKVYDDSTKKPINATVKFYQMPEKKPFGGGKVDSITGIENTFPCGYDYYIEIVAEGYVPKIEEITLECEDFEERELEIFVTPEVEGISWDIEHIYFEFNRATLLPESFPELDKLVDIMKDAPNVQVEISGHTDARGKDAYNLSLSQRRAESVVNYLTEHGVNKKQLVAKGYGEQHIRNKCTNGVSCSEEEHQHNRRVEFKILKVK